jgi:galactokinase
MKDSSCLKQKFRERFGETARVFRAPGRVNLIGEHTDYNAGFVMPAAIGLYTWAAISPRPDRKLVVHSENFQETCEFDLNEAGAEATGHWSDYVRGVGVVLEKAGHRLSGANLLVRGEVPIGAGLSSSAAIEVATGISLLENSGIAVDRAGLARLCQRAENEFVGMRCGIMDQFVSCFGQANHALVLDCRSLSYQRLPLGNGARLIVCNTMVKHALAGGEYNRRRAECEEAVRLLGRVFAGIHSLRDLSAEQLESGRNELPDGVYRRARHVVTENQRVLQAARGLQSGDLTRFGELMHESHASLKNDFEVSCRELDTMVRLASNVEGVYGARMTGGGFGGCTVNLVRSDCVDAFQRSVSSGYERETGMRPDIYICDAAEGAGTAPE